MSPPLKKKQKKHKRCQHKHLIPVKHAGKRVMIRACFATLNSGILGEQCINKQIPKRLNELKPFLKEEWAKILPQERRLMIIFQELLLKTFQAIQSPGELKVPLTNVSRLSFC